MQTTTGGARGGSVGGRTSPLFENMGRVIRPNLHRNRWDGRGAREEMFWRFNLTKSLKILVVLSDENSMIKTRPKNSSKFA